MAPSLRPDERARMDRFISGYTGEIMVDGVPSQGGARRIFKKILSPAAKSVATGFFTELGASLASILTSWFPANTERNHRNRRHLFCNKINSPLKVKLKALKETIINAVFYSQKVN